MPFAHCTPDDAWAIADFVGVRSLSGAFGDVVLPVEHRDEGNYTIERSEYPNGVILIPTGCDPTAIPAVLPVLVSAGSSQAIALEPANLLDSGCGGGVIFV